MATLREDITRFFGSRDNSTGSYAGEYYLPDSPGYKKALSETTSANFCMVGRTPPVIFLPKTTKDIAWIFKFVTESYGNGTIATKNKQQYSVTVLSGGHSEVGVQNDSLVVYLKHFRDIQVLPASSMVSSASSTGNAGDGEMVVTFGGGSKLGDIADECAKKKVAAPLGTYWSVGCGLVLQGGMGKLTRFASVSCDNIVEVEIVCIDGTIKKLNEEVAKSEKDAQELWWAVRGAGVCLGVVTKLTMRTYPVQVVHKVTPKKEYHISAKTTLTETERADKIKKELAGFAGEMTRLEDLIRTLPNSQQCDVFITVASSTKNDVETKTVTIELNLSSLSSPEFSTEVMNEFGFTQKEVESMSYADYSIYKASDQSSEGVSSYMRTIWLDKIGAPYWNIILDRMFTAPSEMNFVSLQNTGGAVREKKETVDSVFNCRDFEFSCVIGAIWEKPEKEQAARGWGDALFDECLPIATGTYPADIDGYRRPNQVVGEMKLAFQENYVRLKAIKAKVDPLNILRTGYSFD